MTPVPDAEIPVITGLSQIADRYDLMIFDLWGVMHDGLSLHAPAEEAVARARQAGVRTVFLSNAPRPRYHVRAHLLDMGIEDTLVDLVVTSGGLARDYVRTHTVGAKLYHLGPRSDHNTIEGLPVTLVDHAEEAEVILATDLDHYDVEGHARALEGPASRGVPFLCANPDRVVHVGDRLVPCAGAVADLYERMDGPVHWFGKPTRAALRSCLHEAGLADTQIEDNRVLMIGDSLQTDIAGAHNAGFHGCLVSGGIHRDDLAGHLTAGHVEAQWFQDHVAGDRALPHLLMQRLAW